MGDYKYTSGQVIAALKNHDGLQAAAANELGCCERTIRYYAERFPEVKQTIEHLKEAMLDEAETQLYKKIRNGDLGAICFFLKCQGKARHYSEKLLLAGPDGGPIQQQVNVSFDWSKVPDEELKPIVNVAEKYLQTL